jgi:hypothetical protein
MRGLAKRVKTNALEPGATLVSNEEALHLLPQNEDLAHSEYPAIQLRIEQVRSLYSGAADYVKAHGLDPDVFLPRNIWAELDSSCGFPNWSYDLVNYSRAVSAFSGFHMLLWGRHDMPGDLDPEQAKRFYADLFSGVLAGKDIAARMQAIGVPQRIARSRRNLFRWYSDRHNLARKYDRLVAPVPGRFRIEPPKRGGEIGLLHRGRILNPDVLVYQSRMNALYGAGVLEAIDRVIDERGSANYLEIGPGHCFFAWALRSIFGERLKVFLIDLPFVMANGVAYISCVAGEKSVGVASPESWPSTKGFVFVPNYLVPAWKHRLPKFDLIHNALSLNEMNEKQVAYYLDLIDRHLAEDGVFHLSRGGKYLDYHQDALGAATRRLRLRKLYRRDVEGVPVIDAPNSFFESTIARR